jgi:ATPase subunit of ABC transporter with duplicated ATPase domains
MLVLDDISIRVAGRLLLDGASVRIPDGARVGLVGPQRHRQDHAVPRDHA